MRGLKRLTGKKYFLEAKSHPTWVRGLKQKIPEQMKLQRRLHPTWVRGLKHQYDWGRAQGYKVAQ